MPLEINIALYSDVSFLVENNLQLALETENLSLDFQTVTEGIEAVFNDLNKGFYLIAKHETERAGSLLITCEWSDWRNANIWWIQSVYVKPEFRRKGIYSRLLVKLNN